MGAAAPGDDDGRRPDPAAYRRWTPAMAASPAGSTGSRKSPATPPSPSPESAEGSLARRLESRPPGGGRAPFPVVWRPLLAG